MTKSNIPVARAFRVWLGVEVLFGLATLLSLGRFPEETATRFAWPIVPTLTAAVLGGFYLSLTPVLVLALFVRRWSMVRVIVLPALAFTTAELLATILHWDRFSKGTLPFNVARQLHPAATDLPGRLPVAPAPLLGPIGQPPPAVATHGSARIRRPLQRRDGRGLRLPAVAHRLVPLDAHAPHRQGAGRLADPRRRAPAVDGLRGRPRPRAAGQPLPDPAAPTFVLQLLRYGSEVDVSSPRLWIALALFSALFVCEPLPGEGKLASHDALSLFGRKACR